MYARRAPCVDRLPDARTSSTTQTPARALFRDTDAIRIVYFAILVSHVLLAATILPLALTTTARGLRAQYGRHVKVARWTLPIWLYVSVTGVVIYVMLYHLY